MDAIITDPVTAQKQVKTRAVKITIHNPFVGDANIRFTGERMVLLDGEPLAPLGCPDVSRNFAGVAAEVKTITDPVTGQSVSLSVAGVAEFIAKCFCEWYTADEAAREAAAAAEAARIAAAAAEAARLLAEEQARQAAEEAARQAAQGG